MIDKYLYVIQSEDSDYIKIGRTNNPKKRLSDLQSGNPNKLSYLILLKGKGYLEKSIHEDLKSYRVRGEWFKKSCIDLLRVIIDNTDK
jgi:hypothetical protein